MAPTVLCCDWGTSFFRLQLLNPSTYQCIGERFSSEGVADTFDAWRHTNGPGRVSRETFFRQQLTKQIHQLTEQLSLDLSHVPVVVSGMASSSIGLTELPYANLPFAVDGSQASCRHFSPQPDFPHKLLLISGVRSEQDVMRGEETQLVGLITLLSQSGSKSGPIWMEPVWTDRLHPDRAHPSRALFIFPGTHSKHLYIRDGQLVNFATYMTGELFHLMATDSILNDSVDTRYLADFSADNIRAFRLGVTQSSATNLLNGLFTTRTNQLFDKFDKTANAFYLSGLLIGSELNYLQTDDCPLVLCGGSKLATFYDLAIATLNLSDRTTTIPADLIDRAASVGQVIFFQNQAVPVTTTPTNRL